MALYRCVSCGRAKSYKSDDIWKPCMSPMCGGMMERVTLEELLAEAKARRENGETDPDGPQ